MDKKLKLFLKLIFGFLLLAFAINKAGINKILDLKIDVSLLILILILTPFPVIIKTIKWRKIISTESKIPFLKCFRIYIMGLFFGSVTPSRIGELSRAYHLTKIYKFPAGHSTASVVIDKMIDLLALSVLAVLGAIFFQFGYPGFLSSFSIFVIVFISISILIITIIISNLKSQSWILAKIGKRQRFLNKLFSRLINKDIDTYKIAEDTFVYLRKTKNNTSLLLILCIMSLIVWMFDFVYVYIIIKSLGGAAPFSYLFILIPVSALISLIPVSISGIGTR